MTLRVVFRRAAKNEFEDAAVWYGEKGPGLGDEFIREIEQAVASAAAAPQRYPVVLGDIRRTVARRNNGTGFTFPGEVDAAPYVPRSLMLMRPFIP